MGKLGEYPGEGTPSLGACPGRRLSRERQGSDAQTPFWGSPESLGGAGRREKVAEGGVAAASGAPGLHQVGPGGASCAAAVSGLVSLPRSRATINLG